MQPNDNKKRRKKITILVTFFVTITLIAATYAWFSASLNVKVKFFDVKVSTDTGLFISLDGINYSDTVEISKEAILDNLNKTYPNNTNQWASNGLWSVSTNGILSSNQDKFSMFQGEIRKYRTREKRGQKYVDTYLMKEEKRSSVNSFISFDIFLKNVSGSPKKDNLYLTDGTEVYFDEKADSETKEKMQDILNTVRIGLLKIGETNLNASPSTIQNLKCNPTCEAIIFEPNHLKHNEESINAVKEYGKELFDNTYVDTYGVIKEGKNLDYKSGIIGGLDNEHFSKQNTITINDIRKPVFQVPNGITKVRVYLWLEGQDIDALEVHSEGAPIILSLDLEKDLAGYDGY